MLGTSPKLMTAVVFVALCISVWLSWGFDKVGAFDAGLQAYRYHDLGTLDAHIADLSESSDVETVELRVLKAAAALLRNRPTDAVTFLSEVEPSETLSAVVLQIRGDALYRLERYGEAEDCLRRLVDISPDDVRAHRLLAVIFYDIGAMEQAIRHLKEIMRLAPNDYRPHRLIGQVYFDFEKYVEAARAFREVLSLSADLNVQAEARQFLAQAECKLGNFEAALAALEPVSQMSDTFGIQAECMWNLGRSDEARLLLTRALASPEPDAAAALTFARISLEDGNPDAAVTVLTAALAREPGCVDCRHQLAMAYRAKGDLELCQQQLAANEKIKKLKTRLTTLASAAINQPSDWEVRLEMADICEQLGMHKMSDAWRRAAGALQPKSGG